MKRKTIITTGAWSHEALWNQQRLKRRLEHSFRVVTQLPIHFAPQQIFKNRTKQVRFCLLFNFHLQFTNKSVGSLSPAKNWITTLPQISSGCLRAGPCASLPRRRFFFFWGGGYFFTPPHKRLLNRRHHSFPHRAPTLLFYGKLDCEQSLFSSYLVRRVNARERWAAKLLTYTDISLTMYITQWWINVEFPHLWYMVVLLPQKRFSEPFWRRGSPSSKYEHRRASALLHNIRNIRICLGKNLSFL